MTRARKDVSVKKPRRSSARIANRAAGENSANESEEKSSAKSINSLPDEMLFCVFSVMYVEDLALTVQHVCKRWRRIAADDRLWKNARYIPSPDSSEDDIIKVLKNSPKLRWSVPGYEITGKILKTLADYCKELRGLFFDRFHAFYEPVLFDLVQKCPHLEYVETLDTKFYDTNLLHILAVCKNLEFLNLGGRANPGVFSAVAKGCPSLESLDVRNLDHEARDLAALLTKKKDKMKSLFFNCCDAEDKTYCMFPAVSKCTKLKLLSVTGHRGKIESFVKYFQSQSVKTLTQVHLSSFENFSSKLLSAIFENCPNLCSLSLDDMQNFNENFLKGIDKLKNLEYLSLSDCGKISNVGMTHVKKCKMLTVFQHDSNDNLLGL